MGVPSVSVVIPTFNGKKRIMRCLDSINNQTLGPSSIEVIVVDDGSTDGTADVIREKPFGFELEVVEAENGGPPHARNIGAGRARADIVAFLDDDVTCRPDCFENALRHFGKRNADVVEATLLLEGTDRPLLRYADSQGFITAALFFRKRSFVGVGGMDEAFFDKELRIFFRDDSDLGFRLVKAGCVTIQPDDIMAWHPEIFHSLRDCFAHARRYLFDPLLYRKHPELYRSNIERKRIGPITIRRPMHYACLAAATATVVAIVSQLPVFIVAGSVVLISTTAVRYKFRGTGALQLWKIVDTLAFLAFPFWYLYWFFRGCLKFRSFGAIL